MRTVGELLRWTEHGAQSRRPSDHQVVRLPAAAPSLDDGRDLRLRGHRADDLDAIVEQCQDLETIRWTTVPVPYREGDARTFLRHAAQGWRDGITATFAIEFRGRFAGTVDLRCQEGSWAEVGFGLTPSARGNHVMRRALTVVLNWAFDDLQLAGVSWRAHVGNDASRRVAEACGFRVEGTVRGLCLQRGARVDAWIGTIRPGEVRQVENGPAD